MSRRLGQTPPDIDVDLQHDHSLVAAVASTAVIDERFALGAKSRAPA
jgi:hypothetical protein